MKGGSKKYFFKTVLFLMWVNKKKNEWSPRPALQEFCLEI